MVNNPFIPEKDADLVIIDGRISEDLLINLDKDINLKILLTTPCEEVADPISYHPDIVLHPVNNKTIVAAPNVFEYYKEKLYGMGIKIIKGERKLEKKYPNDIAYNVGRIHNFAIHNFKHTDEVLKYYLRKENLEFIHVEQGYTKCSMAVIGDNAVITSDYPIYKKLTDLGVDVLLIEPGHIRLDGYPYGFIGGTCGNLSKQNLVFSGKFSSHPDNLKILKFLRKYEKNVIWLSDNEAIDIGTIISLNCQMSNSL